MVKKWVRSWKNAAEKQMGRKMGCVAKKVTQTFLSVRPYCAKMAEETHTRTLESLKPGVGLVGNRDLSVRVCVRVRKAIIGSSVGKTIGVGVAIGIGIEFA